MAFRFSKTWGTILPVSTFLFLKTTSSLHMFTSSSCSYSALLYISVLGWHACARQPIHDSDPGGHRTGLGGRRHRGSFRHFALRRRGTSMNECMSEWSWLVVVILVLQFLFWAYIIRSSFESFYRNSFAMHITGRKVHSAIVLFINFLIL